MSGRDPSQHDIDARLRAETVRLLAEMDALMKRAKLLLESQGKVTAELAEQVTKKDE